MSHEIAFQNFLNSAAELVSDSFLQLKKTDPERYSALMEAYLSGVPMKFETVFNVAGAGRTHLGIEIDGKVEELLHLTYGNVDC